MTISELICKLQDCDPNARVYVDWDREGGNETEATEVEVFRPGFNQELGLKIK